MPVKKAHSRILPELLIRVLSKNSTESEMSGFPNKNSNSPCTGASDRRWNRFFFLRARYRIFHSSRSILPKKERPSILERESLINFEVKIRWTRTADSLPKPWPEIFVSFLCRAVRHSEHHRFHCSQNE